MSANKSILLLTALLALSPEAHAIHNGNLAQALLYRYISSTTEAVNPFQDWEYDSFLPSESCELSRDAVADGKIVGYIGKKFGSQLGEAGTRPGEAGTRPSTRTIFTSISTS